MENSSPTQNEPVNLNGKFGQELLVFLWLYFIFLDKFEMLQNIFHNSHYLDQKSAGNLKLSSSFSQNLALISTSFVNFPYNVSQHVMKKSENRSLGVKCHKNPSLKYQIFKTFPFPGERNKDKYLPLKPAAVSNVTAQTK